MSDQRIFELVWENGQLEARGLPKRSQKSPSCNNGRQYGGDTPKRPKFETPDSAVDDFNSNSALRNVYESHFNEYFSEHKLLKDTQVVPVHETAPTGNSQLFSHQFSLQQQHQQVSAPLKRPREIFPKLKKLGNHLNLEPERKKELVNFSLFSRSAAVPACSRAEQNKQELGPAAYGSKSVIQTQLNSAEINEDRLPPDANKSVPDVQSKAGNSQTSSLPFANTPAKGNLDAGKCKEPPIPSSSFCSLGASNNPTYNTFKTRYEDTEGSTCPSDHNEEKPERKTMHRGSKSNDKKRAPEAHNLSERRRRDKINKKMRALQELIPNCNKVDRASMLDEAIEYLKTLQFQVKMMSMGTGVCMSPMMLPYGMHQMPAPQMSHFSPMGVGWNPAQFLIPPIARATAVPGIFPETRIPVPGFPGQLLPMSMLSASLGLMHKTIPVAGSMEFMDSAPLTNSKDSVQNIVEVNKRYVDRSKIQRSV